MLITQFTVVTVLFDHEGSHIRHVLRLLQDENCVSLLGAFRSAKDRGHLQVILVVNFLRMNDQEDVDFALGRKTP